MWGRALGLDQKIIEYSIKNQDGDVHQGHAPCGRGGRSWRSLNDRDPRNPPVSG